MEVKHQSGPESSDKNKLSEEDVIYYYSAIRYSGLQPFDKFGIHTKLNYWKRKCCKYAEKIRKNTSGTQSKRAALKGQIKMN